MICVYPADCTDFSNNGMGAVSPSSCTFTETLNGEITIDSVLQEAYSGITSMNSCTYQFYEHRGFLRVEEKDIVLHMPKGDVPLKCLVYSKKM